MLNRCRGRITLGSSDRLDKLMVLFIVEKMNLKKKKEKKQEPEEMGEGKCWHPRGLE